MKAYTYIITDPEGLHARPAGLLVKEANRFQAKVTVEIAGKEADAKRIFAVMGLGVKSGQEIVLRVDGEDEEEALQSISEFLEANL